MVAQRSGATRVVDMLDGGKKANPKPSLAQGTPATYTSETPAELVAFKGNADSRRSSARRRMGDHDQRRAGHGRQHVLRALAGRWFRAASLAGPSS
jgi:hypothetical protein